jgi:hypothetical protein
MNVPIFAVKVATIVRKASIIARIISIIQRKVLTFLRKGCVL